VCGKDGSRADLVFISSVSCWGNLGIIFLRERETLALSSMTTPRIGCSWWIGNIQELPASEKIEVTHDENEGSDGSSVLLILVVSFFLLNFLDLVVFLCCSVDFFSYFWNFFSVSCQWKTVVLAGLVVFLKGCSGWSNCFSLFSLVANWWWGKVVPASLYQWKTVVPLVAPLSRHSRSSSERLLRVFSSSTCKFLLVAFFLFFFISFFPRRLLVERHWVG